MIAQLLTPEQLRAKAEAANMDIPTRLYMNAVHADIARLANGAPYVMYAVPVAHKRAQLAEEAKQA